MFGQLSPAAAPVENETSWVVEELKNELNILRLRIEIKRGTLHTYSSNISREFRINNAVSVQMRMCSGHSTGNFNFCPESNSVHIVLFIKLAKVEVDDKESYCANVYSKKNFISNTLITDDKTWRLIDCTALMPFNFDITIVMDVLRNQVSPFASLYDDTDSTDLKLVGDDGDVDLHGAVLAAYSPVFKSKLCDKALESPRPFVIELPGVHESTLKHLKKYIYLHTVPDSLDKELLLFAKEYNMTEFVQMCTDKMIGYLTAKNINELLTLALDHDITELYLNMLQLIENCVIKVKDIKTNIDTIKNTD